MPAYPLQRSWIGAILALLVLVVDVVLMFIGQMELRIGTLIAGLGLAYLL